MGYRWAHCLLLYYNQRIGGMSVELITIRRFFSSLLFSIGVFSIASIPVQATVVRMDVIIGDQPAREVYIELYDAEAPLTVANFLSYVDDGNGNYRYDGTFIHRSVDIDTAGVKVVQGGAFKYANTEGATGIVLNEYDPEIGLPNEYDATRPNNRGTIAMARTTALNSATSQWFINMVNNPLPDFAVFGRVLGSGMDVIDAISALPTENRGSPFTDLPIATPDRNPVDPITESDLVTIERVVINPPARISADSMDLNFGLVTVGETSTTQTITISNIGGIDLTIGDIASSNSLDATFLITGDQCSVQTLAPFETCQISLQYQPAAFGDTRDSLNIPSGDMENPNIVISLLGSGAFPTPTLDVDLASIDFGSLGLGGVSERTVTIQNIGGSEIERLLLLPATGITISGPDEVDFSVPVDSVTCTTEGLSLAETCIFIVRFTANTLPVNGEAESATLTITTEDPYAQTISLDLSALVAPSQARLVMPVPSDGSGTINLGDVQSGETVTLYYVPFGNEGTEDLVFYDISIVGDNADEFSITRNCTQVTPAAGFCRENITFSPITMGTKSALLQVQSNDPEIGFATIPIIATASADGDGIPASVEAAGPNGGDANQDGVPDDLQNNVASLPDVSGNYVAITSPDGTTLRGVSVSGQSPAVGGRVPDTPVPGASVTFRKGFFSFVVEDVPLGGTVAVTLHFPTEQSENSYFKYGWLPGERALGVPEHWYLFDFKEDSGTGATFNGKVITLYLTDGGRGDNDQAEDGRIVDPGGPAVVTLADAGGGGGGGCNMRRSGSGGNAFDLVLLLAGILLLRVIPLFSKRGNKSGLACQVAL